MVTSLQLAPENLKEAYQAVVRDLFKIKIDRGVLLMFVIFSGEVLHCARSRTLAEHVPSVVDLVSEVKKWILNYVSDNGGWERLMESGELFNLYDILSIAVVGVTVATAIYTFYTLCKRIA